MDIDDPSPSFLESAESSVCDAWATPRSSFGGSTPYLLSPNKENGAELEYFGFKSLIQKFPDEGHIEIIFRIEQNWQASQLPPQELERRRKGISDSIGDKLTKIMQHTLAMQNTFQENLQQRVTRYLNDIRDTEQHPNRQPESTSGIDELLTFDDGYLTDQKEPGVSVECQTESAEPSVEDLLDVTVAVQKEDDVSVECQTESMEVSVENLMDLQEVTVAVQNEAGMSVECQTESAENFLDLQEATAAVQKEAGVSVECQTDSAEVSVENLLDLQEATAEVQNDSGVSVECQTESAEVPVESLLDLLEVTAAVRNEAGVSVECQTESTEVSGENMDLQDLTAGVQMESVECQAEVLVENLLDLQDVTAVFAETDLPTASTSVQTCLTETAAQVMGGGWIATGSECIQARAGDDFIVNEMLADELEKAKRSWDEAEYKNQALQAEVIAVNHYNETLRMTFEKERKEVEELRRKFESLTEDKENLPTGRRTLPDIKNNTITELDERLAERNARCLELEELLDQATKKLQEQPPIEAVRQLCTDYSETRAIAAQRQTDLEAKETLLTELKERLAEQEEELATKQLSIEDYDEQIERDMIEIENLTKALQQANGKISEQMEEIERLTGQFNGSMDTMDKLRAEVALITQSAQHNSSRSHSSTLNRSMREHATSMNRANVSLIEAPTVESKFTETDVEEKTATRDWGTMTEADSTAGTMAGPVPGTRRIVASTPISSTPIFTPASEYTGGSIVPRSVMRTLQRPLSPVREKRKATELIGSGVKQSGGGLRKRTNPNANVVNMGGIGDRRSTVGVAQGGSLLRLNTHGPHGQSRIPLLHPKSRYPTAGPSVAQSSQFGYGASTFGYQHQPISAGKANFPSRPSDFGGGRPSRCNGDTPANCAQQ